MSKKAKKDTAEEAVKEAAEKAARKAAAKAAKVAAQEAAEEAAKVAAEKAARIAARKAAKRRAKAGSGVSDADRLRAEVTVLRLIVDRMLLVQARNLGKEAYLTDLHDGLMSDLDRAENGGKDPLVREVMNLEIERSLEAVRAQLLLARADRSKRN